MLVSVTKMRWACYALVSISASSLFKTGKVCGGEKKIKGETTLNRMREDHLSFGCSFRLFFILSEPVVPPLITTVLRHSWVWSLEILKWAKIFSYVIYLRCVSVDHFKWSSVLLLVSPPASDPVFAIALALKGSHHSFLLNLRLSQQHRGPCSSSHNSDAQIKLSGSNAVLQKEQRDHSSSRCIFIESLQCLGFFTLQIYSDCTAGNLFHLLRLWVFLKPGKNFSSQSRWCSETLGFDSPVAFILFLRICCKSQCMRDSNYSMVVHKAYSG